MAVVLVGALAQAAPRSLGVLGASANDAGGTNVLTVPSGTAVNLAIYCDQASCLKFCTSSACTASCVSDFPVAASTLVTVASGPSVAVHAIAQALSDAGTPNPNCRVFQN